MPIVDTDRLRVASAATIKSYRAKLKLTQQAVSDHAELSRSYISELEDGKHLPTIETLFRLALPFEVQPQRLLKEIFRRYSE